MASTESCRPGVAMRSIDSRPSPRHEYEMTPQHDDCVDGTRRPHVTPRRPQECFRLVAWFIAGVILFSAGFFIGRHSHCNCPAVAADGAEVQSGADAIRHSDAQATIGQCMDSRCKGFAKACCNRHHHKDVCQAAAACDSCCSWVARSAAPAESEGGLESSATADVTSGQSRNCTVKSNWRSDLGRPLISDVKPSPYNSQKIAFGDRLLSWRSCFGACYSDWRCKHVAYDRSLRICYPMQDPPAKWLKRKKGEQVDRGLVGAGHGAPLLRGGTPDSKFISAHCQ